MGAATESQVGRPTVFKPEYIKQAQKLCYLGATDIQLADFFGVCKATINNWKKDYPEFLDSIKKAKIEADMKVAKSFYERATGYTHKDRHYSPEPVAQIYWLNNRQSETWRDKQEVDHSGNMTILMLKKDANTL